MMYVEIYIITLQDQTYMQSVLAVVHLDRDIRIINRTVENGIFFLLLLFFIFEMYISKM
jgi:hypothetical protein